MSTTRFPIRFAGTGRALLGALGVSPANSAVEVGDDELRARMGWMFSLSAPLADVAGVAPVEHRWWWGVGAHIIGSHTWITNGATDGLVVIRFRRLVPGRSAGIPIRVARYIAGVEDAEGLVGALSPA